MCSISFSVIEKLWRRTEIWSRSVGVCMSSWRSESKSPRPNVNEALSPLCVPIKYELAVWQISFTSFFSASSTVFPAHIKWQLAKHTRGFCANVYFLQAGVRLLMAVWWSVQSVISRAFFFQTTHNAASFFYQLQTGNSKVTSAYLCQNNASICFKHVGSEAVVWEHASAWLLMGVKVWLHPTELDHRSSSHSASSLPAKYCFLP